VEKEVFEVEEMKYQIGDQVVSLHDNEYFTRRNKYPITKAPMIEGGFYTVADDNGNDILVNPDLFKPV